MTSSIGSLPAGQSANEALGASKTPSNTLSGQAAASAASAGKPVEPVAPPDPVIAAGGSQASEAVTLSADAQATAQLLDAARAADGVDTGKVVQLRQAVQTGGYDAKPEDVAKAILAAFGGAVTGKSA